MSRAFTPKIVAANDLLNGRSVWLTELGGWAHDPADALLLTTEDEAAHHLAIAEAQTGIVVGPTLIDAVRATTGPTPVHVRERIRVTGPFVDPTIEKAA